MTADLADSSTRFPEFLVSVRDRAEFDLALACGVDIIDLKEPQRGPLAAADSELWEAVADVVARESRVQLSAALGERSEAEAIASRLPRAFSFAKAGPSGCGCEKSLCEMWRVVASQLPPSTELVAVAYADHLAAGCASPEVVLRAANQAGIRRYLIDTWTKDGRSTVSWLGTLRLQELSGLASELGIWWALAGSLTRDHVSSLAEPNIRPNCFAVRGDVCEGGRGGQLSAARIADWQSLLSSGCTPPLTQPTQGQSC